MSSRSSEVALGWVEQGLVPDAVVRLGIRRLLKERLTEIGDGDGERSARIAEAFVATLADAPVALETEKANEQHYEVPAEFFARVLGPHRKYSACWWDEGTSELGDAEADALAATCERAGLVDGQRVLELGCGWARSRCGWPSATRRAASRRSPIRTRSTATSRPRRRGAV